MEDVVKAAVARNMHTLALTEHMPREQQDLYPEEVSIPHNPFMCGAQLDPSRSMPAILKSRFLIPFAITTKRLAGSSKRTIRTCISS